MVLLDAAGRINESVPADSFRERLIKYVPVETLSLYVAMYGITFFISGSESWYPLMARWLLVAGILGTPLFLWQAEGVTDPVQLGISTLGFIIWASALGTVTFTGLPLYHQIAASVLLVIWVFCAPFIDGMPDRW